MRKNIVIGTILGLCTLAPFLYNVTIAFSRESPKPFLEMPQNEKECIRDTQYMRFNHFLLLKRERDKVVREGKKKEIGFNDCRRCHINREQFCNRCHKMVNLIPDCFGCHYYPEK